jgi:hypothetical protein
MAKQPDDGQQAVDGTKWSPARQEAHSLVVSRRIGLANNVLSCARDQAFCCRADLRDWLAADLSRGSYSTYWSDSGGV